MTTTIIAPPDGQALSLEQVKKHLRIDHVSEDDYLAQLINAATEHTETYLSKHLINRTLRQYLDDLPRERRIALKAWPVAEIIMIIGYDRQGSPHIIAPEYYSMRRHSNYAYVSIAQSVSRTKFVNGLEIDFISGYGDQSGDIPSNITQALLVLVANWYECRGALSADHASALIPSSVEKLLSPMRKVKL